MKLSEWLHNLVSAPDYGYMPEWHRITDHCWYPQVELKLLGITNDREGFCF